jgi:hypothetical protein
MCFLVVASLTTGSCLRAEDPSAVPHKDSVVPIKTGDAISPVKVQESDPYQNLHVPAPSDKYDPTRYSMNQTSSLAGKPFTANMFSPSKNGATFTQDKGLFATKAYNQTNGSDLGKNYTTTTSNGFNRSDSQFEKNYGTPTSKMGSSQSSSFSNASKDQNRTSSFSGKTSEIHSANLAKQYLGPGAQHVPGGSKDDVVIAHVSDIPDRPLSIDEVRGLINHGFKPDTTVAPDAPTKSLNDPGYKQEASPEPPEAPGARGPASDDDKDAPLPSPGAMAQPPPENSESLPQH